MSSEQSSAPGRQATYLLVAEPGFSANGSGDFKRSANWARLLLILWLSSSAVLFSAKLLTIVQSLHGLAAEAMLKLLRSGAI